MPDAVRETLTAYDWPGNVRALRHAVERAVILSGDAPLAIDDFSIRPSERPPVQVERSAVVEPAGEGGDLNLERVERRLVETALKKHGYNISAAAAELGLTRASLYRRMEKHGL